MELSGEIHGLIYVKQRRSAGHLVSAHIASCPGSPWAALPRGPARGAALCARWACGPGVGLFRVPGSPGTLSKVLKAEDIMGRQRTSWGA